ncbi:helix-turn-helix domain-containing protein [Phytohabitans aurantiacus]|uniref:Regulatory protein n=1 Tax=Phytohabitans aurantiacus TaxID=3016789 RepID=A0ABQ5R9P4_9ACTN|nr:helix-turn-helix domain-containing protein [Phytohabitans aurantiacus]GLI02301.1 putative regulatory protein [Phytohabitans aurantiacus]
MLRIVLTADDLTRVRFEAAPGPLVDAGLAARALRRRPVPALANWRAAVAPAITPAVHPLLALNPPAGPTCTFVEPLAAELAAGLESLDTVPAERRREEIADLRTAPTAWLKALASGDRSARADLARAATRMHEVAVAPVAAHLAADREADIGRRAAELGTGGLAAAVSGLHRTLRLRGQVLEVERPFDYEHRSGGTGVLMLPSPFLVDEVRIGWSEGEPLRIHYPTGTPLPGHPDAAPADPLARMLGGTRAAVLRAVGTGCGTVALARRVGASPASASEHVTVLREAGLVATARVGRGVRHWLTPLGAQLLRAQLVRRSTPPPR